MPRPADSGDLWIFGYGSLMWDPGFPHVECATAVLKGWRRAFCVKSIAHRGTVERPGLVLGLAQGGTCRGTAYRVAPENVEAVQAYLFERERRRYDAYVERIVPIRLATRWVAAQTYVVETGASGYAGELPDDEIVRRILAAQGERGPNFDYLERTVQQLQAMGIREPALERLYAAARRDRGA